MFVKKFIYFWSFKDVSLFENSFAEDLGANGVTMIGMDERAIRHLEKQKAKEGLRAQVLAFI